MLSRVVEVEAEGRRGSGFLVAPRLVLTAGHVAAAPECRVRSASDDRIWSACRVWSGDGSDLDVALVEVVEAGWDPGPMSPARFGRLVADSGAVRVRAQGFPEFQRQPDGLCDIEELSGKVPAGTRALSRRYQVRVDGEPPRPRGGGSPWQGMSGAALRGAGDLVLGVCVEDPANTRHGRLTAVPAYLFAADEGFRQVVREATGWPTRVEPVELAPLLASPLSPEVRSPAGLLRAQARVVRFHDRQRELASLRDWCTTGTGTDVRLLYGPGGQGKTRLADELVRALSADGWVGGFAVDLDALARDDVTACLAAMAVPTLLVVDYAETRRQDLPRLIGRAHQSGAAPVRILLLARSAGDWWATLRADAQLEVADAEPLEPLRPGAVAPEFKVAATDLAAGLRRVPGYEDIDWPDLDARADPAGSGHALSIHMAALAALLQHGSVDGSVEDVLLAHEGRYWRRNATAAGLDLGEGTLREAVAAATLFGAAGRDEAHAVVRTLPGLGGQPEDVRRRVAEWLADLYPATDPDAGGWRPLEPDRLGEHLVAAEVRRSPAFLHAAVVKTSEGQHRRALSVLANAAQLHPELDEVIEELSAAPELAATAVDVATRTQRPQPLLTGLGTLHRIMAAKIITPEGIAVHELAAAEETLIRVQDAIPQHSQLLAGFALDVTVTHVGMVQTVVDAIHEQGTPVSAETLVEMANVMDRLGVRLLHTGRLAEAAAAHRRAIAMCRALLPELPDRAGWGLASSSHNLATCLNWADRPEEALEPAQDAVTFYRRLAKDRGGEFALLLASSMDLPSTVQRQIGRTDDALATSRKAVDLHRGLAAADRGRLDCLADALMGYGIALLEADRPEEGVAPAREAVAISRELAMNRPDEFLPNLARTLLNLAVVHVAADQLEDALPKAEEAVAALRKLALALPRLFSHDLAKSLLNYGGILWWAGRGVAAVAPLAEALTIARERDQNGVTARVRELIGEMCAAMPSEVAVAWENATGEPLPDWSGGEEPR